MQFSMSLAEPLLSRRRFKGLHGGNKLNNQELSAGHTGYLVENYEMQREKNGSNSQRGKGRGVRNSDSDILVSSSSRPGINRSDKQLHATIVDTNSRRRNAKVNGADVYVARITRSGVAMGSAKPCCRCLQWCHWAGIKRVFHWDPISCHWERVTVNMPGSDHYSTTADFRLWAEERDRQS